jgi:hypothetical protein
MTVLCPSERFHERRGRRHQTLAERAWPVIRLVVRWLPGRMVVFVADSSYAVLELLARIIHKICECLMNTGFYNFQAATEFFALNPLTAYFTDGHADFEQIHE